jgi:hypothetical protein
LQVSNLKDPEDGAVQLYHTDRWLEMVVEDPLFVGSPVSPVELSVVPLVEPW